MPALLTGTACVLAIVAGGCEAPEEQPWAMQAEAHVGALHEAYSTGFTNVAQFYAEDADVDWTGLLGYHGSGRAGFADLLRQRLQPVTAPRDAHDRVPVVADEPVYVSRTGAVDPMWVQAQNFPHWSQAVTITVAADGISHEIWTGGSFSSGYAGIDVRPLSPVVKDHVAAWAGQDPTAIVDRYAPEATLVDSIAGVTRVGHEAIAAAAASGLPGGGLPGARLRLIPDQGGDGGDAYYLSGWDLATASPLLDNVTHLLLLLDVTDPEGCARQVAALLWMDTGIITREERFHRVDGARRCSAPDELPHGWWDTVTTPRPDTFTATGTFDLHGTAVALWNATPQRMELLEWALERYARLGLPLPTLLSVTFAPPVADPWATYGFLPGALDLVLPATGPGCPPVGCDDWAEEQRTAALAALAQRWVADPIQRELVTTYGAWTPRGQAAGRPDAAEVLTWGLLDAPIVPGATGSPSCADLADAFTALTGRPAPRGHCP